MTTNRTPRSAIAIAILSAAGLLLVACGGGDDADPTTTTTVTTDESDPESTTPPSTSEPSDTQPVGSTEPAKPPSTTTEPIITTDPPNSSQPTDDQEPDWLAVVKGLDGVNELLWEDPDPTRLLDYCSDPSPCLDTTGSGIQNMFDNGWRAVDFTSSLPLSAELIDTSDDAPWNEAAYVTLRVTAIVEELTTDSVVVDSEGNVVYELALPPGSPQPGESSVTTWTITRASGDWRLFEIRTLGG